jgi:hypothetical protein
VGKGDEKMKRGYLVLHQCPSSGKLEGSFLEDAGDVRKYIEGELEIEPMLIDETNIKDVACVIQTAYSSFIATSPVGVKMLVIYYDEEEYEKLYKQYTKPLY